jgi:4-hydroxy-3-methylbut-2-enyl diphosphate reductase
VGIKKTTKAKEKNHRRCTVQSLTPGLPAASMKVIRAKILGFCMGVRRAVAIACAEAGRAAQVFTLGPLIHNPRVLEDLKSRGIGILDEAKLPLDLRGVSIVIRAHGVSPKAEAELRKRGGRIIDATCPKVKTSQLKAKALVESGCRLFLAGEAEHAEIIGLAGYAAAGMGHNHAAEPPFCIVGSAAQAAKAAAKLRAGTALPSALRARKSGFEQALRTALIGQTTISAEEYSAIGGAIKQHFPNLEIIQTICAATKDRQESLRHLLEQAEAVIIAGGKESANTRRLLAIAQEWGKPCVLAENAAGVPPGFSAFKTVGLCAGASTPDTVIDEIEQALSLYRQA